MTKNSCYRNFLTLFLPVLILAFPAHVVAQTEKVISIVPGTSEHHKYCRGLLKLALSYSTTKYRLENFAGTFGSLERDIVLMDQGKLDVAWLPSSEYLEASARPIRVPLYRGLLGMRIFLIHEGDQHRFQQVQTLDDLRAFTFGQGADWPDAAILKANDFQVVAKLGYDNLFLMLDGGRFDVFPRGVFEPWSELESRPELKLEVEKTLAIAYKMPMYFFVAKHNRSLAAEIEQGLNKALEDGSFNKYFFNSPMIKEALEKANMRKRKIFYIDNPSLPAATPLENEKLWWSPLE